MAEVKWTDEQNKVLTAEGNILVSAAAGSGKTAVLTERIVEKVKKGTDICDMLIVTFGKAAAAEMKQRIEKKLYEYSEVEENEETRKHLYAQAGNVPRANISTLHSFYTYLLRRHFYLVDLSPTFRIGDKSEIEMMRAEALDDTLNEFFENDLHYELLSAFSGEQNMVAVINRLYKTMCVRCDGREWLLAAVEKYNVTDEELLTSQIMNKYVYSAKQLLDIAIKSTEHEIDNNEEAANSKCFCEMLEHFKSIRDTFDDYDLTREKLSKQLPKVGQNLSDEIKGKKKYINDNLYKKIKDFYPAPLHEFGQQLRQAYHIMRYLAEVTIRFDEIFSEKKTKRNVIDFADMELLTLKLLRDKAVADVYRNRFEYIFVDEYQDINNVQNEIIRLLMRSDNAFFVGDVKQSIYRFRDAKPSLFIDKMEEYNSIENSSTLGLDANFRSSDAVVDFVNSVFSIVMMKGTGGVDYDEKHCLVKKSDCGRGKVELNLIETGSTSQEIFDEEDDISDLLDIEAQAVNAAQTIEQMIESRTFYDISEKCTRNFRYSDFAIIMRSVKTNGQIFARELLLKGIPAYIEATEGYFAALEIQVFVNLLSVIDNRRQDIPLISVMRSAIGGFSIEEIAAIRTYANVQMPDSKGADFFDALCVVALADIDISEKTADFIDKLEVWNRKSKTMPLEDIVRMLYDDTGYYTFVSALPGGKRRAENLETFANVAGTYAKNNNKGLYDFLVYLDSSKNESDISSAQEGIKDSVHILTMHKSKGLEYNAVIIPSLQKKAVAHDPATEAVLYDEEEYIGARLILDKVVDTDIYHKALTTGNRMAHIADEMRLLYVAFTRARDTLILLASVKDSGELLNKCTIEPSTFGLFISSISARYIDWICLALLNSSHADVIRCATSNECGTANDDLLSVNVTPHSLYKMPEQTIDRSFFYDKIEKLKQLDTSEAQADLEWEYSHKDAFGITSKGSVTGFAHAEIAVSYSNNTAEAFKDEQVVSATQRGTATHLIFERIPLTKHTKKNVIEFAKELVNEALLTQEEFESINMSGIADFFSRPLYMRMLNSERVLREQEFACFVSARMLSDDYNSDEDVMVQGIIDCCFIENGEWVIVDYKTDKVDSKNQEQVRMQADTHKKQLKLYAYILERISGIKVAQCYISFVNAYDVQVI